MRREKRSDSISFCWFGEILSLSDSILIMHEGKFTGYIDDMKHTSEHELGLYMLGVKEDSERTDGRCLLWIKITVIRFSQVRLRIAMLLSIVIIFCRVRNRGTSYNLFLGPLQSKRHFWCFANGVPLIFTGLALSLVFRSGNFSMIADACLFTGAVVTAAMAINTSMPAAIHQLLSWFVLRWLEGDWNTKHCWKFGFMRMNW